MSFGFVRHAKSHLVVYPTLRYLGWCFSLRVGFGMSVTLHLSYGRVCLNIVLFVSASGCSTLHIRLCIPIQRCVFRGRRLNGQRIAWPCWSPLVEATAKRVVMAGRDYGSCCDYIKNLSRQGVSVEQMLMIGFVEEDA